MALTGYYKTFVRPRAHRPLSMIKYNPIGIRSLSGAVLFRQQQQWLMIAVVLCGGGPTVKRSVLFLEQKRKNK